MFKKNYIFGIFTSGDDVILASLIVGRNIKNLKDSSFYIGENKINFNLKLTAKELMNLINDLSDNKMIFDVIKG